MDKNILTGEFSHRLREAMMASGFHSQRSTSGVCIHKLAELTGYSLQICRKYLRGDALPEPVKMMELAAKLNVSPGWLLFGDMNYHPNHFQQSVVINQKVLHLLFTKASCLYQANLGENEVANFLMDLVKDINFINAGEEQSRRIIDLAFASAKHFSKPVSA